MKGINMLTIRQKLENRDIFALALVMIFFLLMVAGLVLGAFNPKLADIGTKTAMLCCVLFCFSATHLMR